MKIDISINEPLRSYGFAEILLCYGEDTKTEVSLNIDYRNLYEFTKRKSGTAFDLFVIASIVYGIDILLPREDIGFDGWSREVELALPVENPNTFVCGKEELETALSFLTGDKWSISFEERRLRHMYKRGARQKVFTDAYRSRYKVVNLFSGGMDSLIGAINQLYSSSDAVCLVSHTDAMFKGAKKDQENILHELRREYRHFRHLPTRVYMEKYDVNGCAYKKETTLRSRSFLFLSMAILVADSLSPTMSVHIPENGTISLNFPLTPSRRSSCSTRTTHPYFLEQMRVFLQKIGLNHSIVNNYQMCTKGEMVEQCLDRDMLLRTYRLSCSCGKRGTRKDIRDNSHVANCGVCMPCVYRRAALHKIGEREEVGTDIFNSQKRAFMAIPDMPALVSYIRKDYTLADIARGLLINGDLPLDKLNDYAEVVLRTREEIKRWIRDEATRDVKRQFGL